MKTINFIFVGKPKDKSFESIEKDFHKKISRYQPSEIIIAKESKEKNTALKKKKETEAINSHVKPGDVIILCDERGKSYDSIKFSKQVENWQVRGKRLIFIIGGAFGVNKTILPQQIEVLKLSNFVFPHDLARTVLLEQVYRALTIFNGEKYHHE